MAGCFLLWRGCPLIEDFIDPYELMAGQDIVCLPGNKSCSKDPTVALGFAFNNLKPEQSPVLFIISCQNYRSPSGIRMNNEAYTAYPLEDEFLLMDGCEAYVL